MAGKKKKVVYDPFQRLARFTCSPENYKNGKISYLHMGEILDSSFTITPPIPRCEVGLTIQFRCSVHLMEGDTITIHMPDFKGASKLFSLETRPHPDGLDTARFFQAYWSGDEKRPGRGKNGLPQKQQLLLRCIRFTEENTLVAVGVPYSVMLVSPEKLALNSTKIRIEGRVAHSEGGRISKQPFLSCTELKKKTLLEEIDLHTQQMEGLVTGAGLSKEMRFVGEEVCAEEVYQLAEAIETRRPFQTEMVFPIAMDLYHVYEDAGGFVKIVMENMVKFTKEHDPLALHKEVAHNWHVKVGAVVILEDILAIKYAGFYPKLSRLGILAAHLLLMTPNDVVHLFSGLSTPPKYSIYHELISAFRMRSLIGSNNDASGLLNRSEAILEKWKALVSVLLTVTEGVDDAEHNVREPFPYEDDSGMGVNEPPNGDGQDKEGNEEKGKGRGGHHVTFFTPDREGAETSKRKNPYMFPPPPLFVGWKDVPPSELQYIRELDAGSGYMFPNFVVAREEYKPLQELKQRMEARKESEANKAAALLAAKSSNLKGKKKNKGSAASPRKSGGSVSRDTSAGRQASFPAAAAGGETNAVGVLPGGGEDENTAFSVPDNAVVFEIRQTVECLEMADLSAGPANKEWLLPFSSSYRVYSVTVQEELNDLTHVVLHMKGSLVGPVLDEMIPSGDRTIASLVARKVKKEIEKSEVITPAIALLAMYNIKRSELYRLNPPTLLREQYLMHFQEVKRAAEAKQTIESGMVVWQICAIPAQQLEEGVIKPPVWEVIPRKYALIIENLFRSRSRTKLNWVEAPGGLTSLSLGDQYTADYLGKGPRPIRRLVKKNITHEAPKPSLSQLLEDMEVTKKTLKTVTSFLSEKDAKKK